MGTGCALANPAIVEAVMSAIPEDKAGAGAGIDGTMTEVGTSLGVAVLGAVMNSRFTTLLPATATGAASLPAAQSATHTPADRAAVLDAFTSAIQTSQLAGATAVLTGGCITALLLWRAERGVGAGPLLPRSARITARPPNALSAHEVNWLHNSTSGARSFALCTRADANTR
ncbi:hypothetical protein GCM10020000_37220 [Streptomyces olivoverticillatus]